jgi:SAM-dependent methyltransferase
MIDTPASVVASTDAERIERERQFHNQRFTEETRLHQGKYYAAIKPITDRFARVVEERSRGADVLEYGCAKGDRSLRLAPLAKTITGIDISDVAVAQGNAAAAAAGLANCKFLAMNAEEMTFPDESFDLVFGCGIVHHLDIERSLREVRRVLRPGGRALFTEPLGINPLINAYRDRTPEARTPDEHPLLRQDFRVAERIFGQTKITFCGLTSIGAVFLRRTPVGGVAMALAQACDKLLLCVPGVRWYAWYTLIEWTR